MAYILLDKNLMWDAAVLAVLKKMSSGLHIYALKFKSNYRDIETLMMVCSSHIHLHISFGLVLYGQLVMNKKSA